MAADQQIRSRAKHRSFSADDKARILAEYEAAATPLERAAIMRRSGVYSSLLSNWRKQLKGGAEPKLPRGLSSNPDRMGCRILGVSRATLERHRKSRPSRDVKSRTSHRRLLESERQAIIDAAHSDRFAELSVREMYAALLDEGVYLGSISTMYRVLRSVGETRERRH